MIKDIKFTLFFVLILSFITSGYGLIDGCLLESLHLQDVLRERLGRRVPSAGRDEYPLLDRNPSEWSP